MVLLAASIVTGEMPVPITFICRLDETLRLRVATDEPTFHSDGAPAVTIRADSTASLRNF